MKKRSCEIEDFVETHLCKLRGKLRSRVLRVLCDLINNVSPYWREQNLTAVELSESINMWLWRRMRPYSHFLDVIWFTEAWGGMSDHTVSKESLFTRWVGGCWWWYGWMVLYCCTLSIVLHYKGSGTGLVRVVRLGELISHTRDTIWSYITRWIGQTINGNRTQKKSGEWTEWWVVYTL